MRFLIVGHGTFPESLASAARMIYGKHPIATVSLGVESDVEEYRRRLTDTMASMAGEPITVLADLPGGSPATNVPIVAREVGADVVRFIAGANLPILLELLIRGTRSLDLATLLVRCAPRELPLAPKAVVDTDVDAEL